MMKRIVAGAWLTISLALTGGTLAWGQAAATEQRASSFSVRVVRPSDAGDVALDGAFVWATCEGGSIGGYNGLEVSLGQTLSDSNGEAHISLAAVEGYPPIDRADCCITVYAFLEGFEVGDLHLFMDEVEGVHAGDIDPIELKPGHAMLGRVLDDQGTPVASANIVQEVWDVDLSGWVGSERDSIDSDVSGYFAIEVTHGERLRLSAWHSRFGAGSCVLPQSGGQFELSLSQELELTSGRLFTAQGLPLQGRYVNASLLSPSGDSAWPHWADCITDEDGRFSFSLPAGGKWEFEVEYEVRRDSESYPEPVHGSAGDQELELIDEGTFLLVRTIDSEGRALNSTEPHARRYRERKLGTYSDVHNTYDLPGLAGENFSERAADGLWLVELPGAGQYELWVENHLGSGYAIGAKRVTVEAGGLQQVTLTIHERPRAGQIELELQSAAGDPLPTWDATLFDARSGRQCGEFSHLGEPDGFCLGPPTYHSPTFPAGRYYVRMTPPPQSFHLPAIAEITLHADNPNPITLRSPGLGGLLLAASEVSPRATRTRKQLRLVLRPAQAEADAAPRRLGLHTWFPEKGPPALLLEPGSWSWELHDREGTTLERGECEVHAAQETRLIFAVRE